MSNCRSSNSSSIRSSSNKRRTKTTTTTFVNTKFLVFGTCLAFTLFYFVCEFRRTLNGGSSLLVASQQQQRHFQKEEHEIDLLSSNCTAIRENPPDIVDIPPTQTMFLHVGKAGGGSILLRAKKWMKVKMEQCHPQPCSQERMNEILLPTTKYTTVNTLSTSSSSSSSSDDDDDDIDEVSRGGVIDPSVVLTSTYLPKFMIGIRDPVDRFVSAFYWKRGQLCRTGENMEKETRIQVNFTSFRYEHNLDYINYCAKSSKSNEELYFLKNYPKDDINVLAESLCEYNEDDNSRNQYHDQAIRDVRKIQHLQYPLEEWMPWHEGYYYVDNKNDGSVRRRSQRHLSKNLQDGLKRRWMEQITPIVLSPGHDFNDQIDSAISWAADNEPNGKSSLSPLSPLSEDRTSSSWIEQRKQFAKCKDCVPISQGEMNALSVVSHTSKRVEQQQKKDKDTEGGSSSSASGSGNSGHSGGDGGSSSSTNKRLTKRSEYCVAQFFKDDYDTIEYMLQNGGCKFDSCVHALQSILNRRKDLLHYSYNI